MPCKQLHIRHRYNWGRVWCFRKRSMLVIPKVRPEDGGKYECRGTGVQTGHVAISSAQVIVNSKPDNSEYNNNDNDIK